MQNMLLFKHSWAHGHWEHALLYVLFGCVAFVLINKCYRHNISLSIISFDKTVNREQVTYVLNVKQFLSASAHFILQKGFYVFFPVFLYFFLYDRCKWWIWSLQGTERCVDCSDYVHCSTILLKKLQDATNFPSNKNFFLLLYIYSFNVTLALTFHCWIVALWVVFCVCILYM